MSEKKEVLSIDSFNIVESSSVAYEMKVVNPATGNETDFTISVIGFYSNDAQSKIRAINANHTVQTALVDKSKTLNDEQKEVKKAELDAEKTAKISACLVVGWAGIKDEFNYDNCLRLMKTCPPIGGQVQAQSIELSNFTKAK